MASLFLFTFFSIFTYIILLLNYTTAADHYYNSQPVVDLDNTNLNPNPNVQQQTTIQDFIYENLNLKRNSKTLLKNSRFLTPFINSAGVVGIGFVWLQQISVAIGSPILIIIFTIPLLCLGILLLFVPYLTEIINEFINNANNANAGNG